MYQASRRSVGLPKMPRTTRNRTLAVVSLRKLPPLRTSRDKRGTAQLLATESAWITAARVTQPCPQMYLERFGFLLWSKCVPTPGAFFEARGTSVSSMTRYQIGGAKLATRRRQTYSRPATGGVAIWQEGIR